MVYKGFDLWICREIFKISSSFNIKMKEGLRKTGKNNRVVLLLIFMLLIISAGVLFFSKINPFYFTMTGFAVNVSSNTTFELLQHIWFRNIQVSGITSNPNNNLIYFGGVNGLFGVYNITTNSSENLSATDTGNWIGASTINSLVYSSHDDLIYIGLYDGKFGAYNRTTNTTEDLSATDAGDWINAQQIESLTYDSNNKLIYFGGVLTRVYLEFTTEHLILLKI